MNTSPPATLLHKITDYQSINANSSSKGLIPSSRYNPAWLYKRPDANLFFTAVSVFTIQQLGPLLTADEQAIADRFIARALPVYARFRNKDGLATYNFYGTNPSAHFPAGWLMHRFRHFQLPDDIDDTAMVYLTTIPLPDDLHFLSEKLAQHANKTYPTNQTTFLDYRHLRAYSTWFGRHMPIEFDACAIANMLCVVYTYDLPQDTHALDSMTYLADIVQTNRYRTDPFTCAPNYARSSLIQYHISRLIATHDPAPLRPVRQQFIADLHTDFTRLTNRADQLLIAISLLRLGETAPGDGLLDGTDADVVQFSFFIAGMLSVYPQPWVRQLARHSFWHIRWQCAAHNQVLLLEYMALNRAAKSALRGE